VTSITHRDDRVHFRRSSRLVWAENADELSFPRPDASSRWSRRLMR